VRIEHVKMMEYGVERTLLVQEVWFGPHVIAHNFKITIHHKWHFHFLPAVTCPGLPAPDNGRIDCSLGDDGVATPEDVCVFMCNEGFHLIGSDIRTCGEDGSWSGTTTTCERPAG